MFQSLQTEKTHCELVDGRELGPFRIRRQERAERVDNHPLKTGVRKHTRKRRPRDLQGDEFRISQATAAWAPSSFWIPPYGTPLIPFTDVRNGGMLRGRGSRGVHEVAQGFYAPPVVKRNDVYTDASKRLPSEAFAETGHILGMSVVAKIPAGMKV